MRLRHAPSIHETERPWHNYLRVYSPSLKVKLMRWSKWKAAVGALALSAILHLPASVGAQPAATATVSVTVLDSRGVALAGAAVEDSQRKLLGRTGTDGKLTVACAAPCSLRVTAEGFSARAFELTSDTTIRMEPAAATEK